MESCVDERWKVEEVAVLVAALLPAVLFQGLCLQGVGMLMYFHGNTFLLCSRNAPRWGQCSEVVLTPNAHIRMLCIGTLSPN